VKVRFRVFLGGDRYVDEEELFAHPVDLGHRSLLKGQIEMSVDGQPPARPSDELAPLVLGLCFGSVVELAGSDHAVVSYFNDYGYLRLDREGPYIRVSGDGVPLVRLPEAGLLPALVDCGARFARWAATTQVPGDFGGALARELEVGERQARAALG
jgi:hypothetical protein